MTQDMHKTYYYVYLRLVVIEDATVYVDRYRKQ